MAEKIASEDEEGSNERNVLSREHKILLSEEKWLVKTLKKIAEQRNSLQVEKLQLKYMLNVLQNGESGEKAKMEAPKSPQPGTSKDVDENRKMMMTFEEMDAELPKELQESDTTPVNEQYLCNQQELNLNVDYPMLSFDGMDALEMEDDSDNDLNYFLNGPNESEFSV